VTHIDVDANRIYSLFSSPSNYVKIISGQDEGAYGWVAVNFLTDIINTLYNNTGNITNCFGTLDLGGASTQITFAPSMFTQPNNKYTLQMAEINYDLYTHSFLSNGVNEAINAVINYTLQKANYPPTISFPCYHYGYSENFTFNGTEYNITGANDTSYDTCDKLIAESQIINASACTGISECSFNGIYQPAIRGNFYAFSTFAFAWDFFKIPAVNNLTVLHDILLGYCVKNFSIVKQENNGTKDPYLKMYCFDGIYIINLLNKGFRFSMNQNITVTNNIGNYEVAWALGAMIVEASLLPITLPGAANLGLIVGIIITIAAVVIVVTIIIVRKRAIQKGLKYVQFNQEVKDY